MQENRPIDMQALRVFLSTAQDCNMSKAAARLGISQSAVSQSIRLLEENFGTPLLNRAARPLTLTAAGMALLNRGSLLMEEALDLRGAVIEASKGIKPSLRLGLVDSFAATCGTPFVRQLLKNTAHLSVRSGLSPNLGEAFSRRELDLVISSRSLDLEGMANHTLMTEQFFLISPKDAPVCRSVADMVTLARALPIVRFNQQSHLGAQVDSALRRLGLNPARRLEVETADTLTSMVAGGLGWAVTTPLCLLQGARSAPAIRHDFISDLNVERKLYLHFRKGEYGSLGREVFDIVCDLLEHTIKDELRVMNPFLCNLIKVHSWSEDGYPPS